MFYEAVYSMSWSVMMIFSLSVKIPSNINLTRLQALLCIHSQVLHPYPVSTIVWKIHRLWLERYRLWFLPRGNAPAALPALG